MTIQEPNQFGALSQAKLEQFEGSLGCSLPDDYRTFLLACNGGTPEPNIVDFVESGHPTSSDVDYLRGIHSGEYWANLNYSHETFRTRLPEGFLSIGNDSGGNQYILGLLGPRRGQVCFWDHENEAVDGEAPSFNNVSMIADSFTTFIEMLHM